MLSYVSVCKRAAPNAYRLVVGIAVLTVFFSVALGFALGKLLSLGAYIGTYEPLITNDRPLPSRIYDKNRNLITEISQGSSGSRKLLAQNKLTRNLIYALIGREDSTFFEHNGFSLLGTMRAFTYVVLDKLFGVGTAGGGSTLTQQLAGSLKTDRKDISISRKIRELWWSFIFEKHYAKSEILVTYLNNVYFGDRNYGIEAASRFFFGQSARDNSIVESVLAVIQLARPNGDFSPLRNPERAKLRQDAVLDKIVQLGLMTRPQVLQASQKYWDSFDLTKINRYRPKRVDEAPYFSDYVARVLEKELYGTNDLLQAGYSIYTTLDLNIQKQINEIVREEMQVVEEVFQSQKQDLFTVLETQELPHLARLNALFGLNLNLSGGRAKREAEKILKNQFAPTLEVLVSALGLEAHLPMLKMSSGHLDKFLERTIPETAILSVDNKTGNIVAMVGGRNYNINEARLFNRAIDARVPPGSAFKPLYFAAAFEEGVVNSGTPLKDKFHRFINPNGTPYIPSNYHPGNFRGALLPRRALELSLNIPALHVFNEVGFEKSISMSTRLLGITDERLIRRDFPFFFPVALGTAPVAPIQLLRAYTVFANGGIPAPANPIFRVEDRNGNIVYDYEQNSLQQIKDTSRRILSEQVSYIMTKMLEGVPVDGTLKTSKRLYEEKYGPFDFPLAAKTGTADNWSDGWVVGFTPYYTTAVWVGFDRAGNSLGESLYGGRVAGPMFMRTMGVLHQNKNKKKDREDFPRPAGVKSIAVDKRNGYLWVAACGEDNKTEEWFLQGTGPPKKCTRAPKTDVFNFASVSAYSAAKNEEPASIDISSFDFLNDSFNRPLNNGSPSSFTSDTPRRRQRNSAPPPSPLRPSQFLAPRTLPAPLPGPDDSETAPATTSGRTDLNTGASTLSLEPLQTISALVPDPAPPRPSAAPTNLGGNSSSDDLFPEQHQNTRTELDSLIEADN